MAEMEESESWMKVGNALFAEHDDANLGCF